MSITDPYSGSFGPNKSFHKIAGKKDIKKFKISVENQKIDKIYTFQKIEGTRGTIMIKGERQSFGQISGKETPRPSTDLNGSSISEVNWGTPIFGGGNDFIIYNGNRLQYTGMIPKTFRYCLHAHAFHSRSTPDTRIKFYPMVNDQVVGPPTVTTGESSISQSIYGDNVMDVKTVVELKQGDYVSAGVSSDNTVFYYDLISWNLTLSEI